MLILFLLVVVSKEIVGHETSDIAIGFVAGAFHVHDSYIVKQAKPYGLRAPGAYARCLRIDETLYLKKIDEDFFADE